MFVRTYMLSNNSTNYVYLPNLFLIFSHTVKVTPTDNRCDILVNTRSWTYLQLELLFFSHFHYIGGWDGFTFFYLKENGASELNVSMLFFSMVTFEVFGIWSQFFCYFHVECTVLVHEMQFMLANS